MFKTKFAVSKGVAVPCFFIRGSFEFLKKVKDFEKLKGEEHYYDLHQTYSINLIINLVCFLETTIIHFCRMNAYFGYVQGGKLNEQNTEKLNTIYQESNFLNLPTLEKYKKLNDIPELNLKFGNENFQNMQNLISIRNNLIHFTIVFSKTENGKLIFDNDDIQKLYERISSNKNTKNILKNEDDAFPSIFLKYEFCEFYFKETFTFTNNFFQSLNILPFYDLRLKNMKKEYNMNF